AVVLELSTGAKLVRLALDPPACMTSAFGQGLAVESSRFSLVMEAFISDGECLVSVGVG
ncbi:MAG: hypothetical protein QG582_674, partial [Candidatus Thermoplasmatota archaeon]|nr:hypothetical protein [Candidatus Thermoplasmatota archaeon]